MFHIYYPQLTLGSFAMSEQAAMFILIRIVLSMQRDSRFEPLFIDKPSCATGERTTRVVIRLFLVLFKQGAK